MVTESDRISEEHKKELFSILTAIQEHETDILNSKNMFQTMKIQSKMVKLGSIFEEQYIKYGGYMGMLNECKRIELKRKEGELKDLLPKIPDSIKRRFKVKK